MCREPNFMAKKEQTCKGLFLLHFIVLCLLRTDGPENQANNQSQDCGADPAQADGGKGQRLAYGVDQIIHMEHRTEMIRQRPQQIVEGCHQSQAGDPGVHSPVMVEEAAQQRQQDQGDGRGYRNISTGTA